MLRITVILLALLIWQEACADVYKYIDNSGHIYYTDQPKNRAYKLIIKSRPSPFFRSKNSFSNIGNIGSSYSARPYTGANKAKFNELIAQTAQRHQLDERLLHAVIQTESAYNSTAVSSKGAVGLMQLMPDTARRFGVMDRNDPDQNVDGGARYLKYLLSLFPSNIDLVIAAYNAGEHAVINHNNTIPPYPETVNYVKQVLALYKH